MKNVSFGSTVFANLAIVVFGPLRLRNLIVSCFGVQEGTCSSKYFQEG